MDAEKQAVVLDGDFDDQARMTASGVYLIVGLVGTYLCVSRMLLISSALPSPRYILYWHVYLANMAISLCSLVAAYMSYHGRWQLGHVGCQSYATVAMCAGMAAIFLTSLLTFEAYIAYHWKNVYADLTVGQYRAAVVLAWLQALFWASAPLLGWSSYSLEPVGVTCEISWQRTDPNHTAYLTVLMSLGFTIPFALGAFMLFVCWCSPPTDEDDTITWLQSSERHENALLKASTLHLWSSLLAWTPYGLVCLLPYAVDRLSLPPLLIIAPSIAAKAVLAVQPALLPLCSRMIQDYSTDKRKTS